MRALNSGVTAEQVRELLHFDPVTGIPTNRVTRKGGANQGEVAGWFRSGYRRITINGKVYSASRLAWLAHYGVWPVGELEHINGIRDDDRVENLRERTSSTGRAMTQERVRELLSFDLVTGVFTNRAKRGSRGAKGAVTGSPDADGYWTIDIDGKRYKAHRLAWLYVHGEFPADEIDHINGVRDDNRLENLRACTHAENLQNSAAKPGSASGLIGAHWNKHTGKWRAQIHAVGRRHHLGLFPTAEAAHAAYCAAKLKLHTFAPIPRQPLETTP